MQIGELAQRTGLSKDTLRFYEKVGLLPPAPKRENGYRDYPESWVSNLQLLIRARELGFTLEELKQLALLFQQRQLSPREMTRHLAQKEQEIDARIAQLQHLKADIQQALAGHCEFREQLQKVSRSSQKGL